MGKTISINADSVPNYQWSILSRILNEEIRKELSNPDRLADLERWKAARAKIDKEGD